MHINESTDPFAIAVVGECRSLANGRKVREKNRKPRKTLKEIIQGIGADDHVRALCGIRWLSNASDMLNRPHAYTLNISTETLQRLEDLRSRIFQTLAKMQVNSYQ